MTSSLQSPLLLCALMIASVLPAQVANGAGAQQDKNKRKVGGAVVAVQDDFAVPIRECTVSSDGSTAVVCTEDGFVHFAKVDELASGSAKKKAKKKKTKKKGKKNAPPIGVEESSFRYQIEDAFLSADGKRLIGRINPATVGIVAKGPKVLQQLRGMPGLVAMALHPDGMQFAGGMKNGLIRVWDSNTGKPIAYLSNLVNKQMTWLGFTPDGKRMLAGTDDKKLWYFTYPGMEKKQEIDVEAPITHVSFSNDGATMVFHTGDKVQIWEVAAAKAKSSFDTGAPVVRTAVSADGSRIAVAHGGGVVSLHDGTTGQRSFRWDAHPDHEIICLQFIKPKGHKTMLVTAGAKSDVVYWDITKLTAGDDKGDKKGKAKSAKR